MIFGADIIFALKLSIRRNYLGISFNLILYATMIVHHVLSYIKIHTIKYIYIKF